MGPRPTGRLVAAVSAGTLSRRADTERSICPGKGFDEPPPENQIKKPRRKQRRGSPWQPRPCVSQQRRLYIGSTSASPTARVLRADESIGARKRPPRRGGHFEDPARPYPRKRRCRCGLFLATFRGMPTANAEGKIESEGSIGKGAEPKVAKHRVTKWPWKCWFLASQPRFTRGPSKKIVPSRFVAVSRRRRDVARRDFTSTDVAVVSHISDGQMHKLGPFLELPRRPAPALTVQHPQRQTTVQLTAAVWQGTSTQTVTSVHQPTCDVICRDSNASPSMLRPLNAKSETTLT